MLKKFEGVFRRFSDRIPDRVRRVLRLLPEDTKNATPRADLIAAHRMIDGSAFGALEEIAKREPWPFDNNASTNISLKIEPENIRLGIDLQSEEPDNLLTAKQIIRNAVENHYGIFADNSRK